MKLALAPVWVALAVLPLVAPAAPAAAQSRAPSTPTEMVAAYDALADVILGARKAERRLVLSLLAAGYGHAQSELGRARQALKGSDAASARAAIENLAAAVGQIGTEGDNAVAGVRKRLLEGGHHANAEGEAQGVYDEGYVVVTKAAKQAVLDSSRALDMLAREPKAEALDAEWKKVEAAWAKHIASAR
ncbi:MAG TPA: hypothetical protein VFM88_05665 [Vicinamibacteria bacterium]|nr:hypothetical protein [Vicinamibacteria bacterium]